MATLVGERLFNYLSNLQKEVSSITQSDKKSDYDGPHHYFAQVIEAEKLFLQKYHKNNNAEPSFAFSGNGLPSVDSLVSDLEAICELSDEDPVFKDMSLKFQKELTKIDKNNYSKTTKKEFVKSLSKMDDKKTIVKARFSLSETEDRTLELKLRDEIYIDSQDDYSQNFPIAIRESTTYYKMVFGELMHHSKEEFLLYNTSMVLSKSNLPERTEKVGLEITNAMAETAQIIAKKSFIGVTKAAVGASQFLYLQPTFFRKHLQNSGAEPVSAFSGMVNIVIAIPAWTFLGPYVALAPLATNGLSGLYEWYRYERNKVLRKKKQNGNTN